MFNIKAIKRKTARGEAKKKREEMRSIKRWIRYVKKEILAKAAEGGNSICIRDARVSTKVCSSLTEYFENRGFKVHSHYDTHWYDFCITISWGEDLDETTV